MGKAIIVGGGIGGLTAALCFLHHGWSVEVCEKALELGEVGEITAGLLLLFRAAPGEFAGKPEKA